MCLAIAQHLLGIPSERHWIRYAGKTCGMFPNIPSQSGYGKRLRRGRPLIADVIIQLALSPRLAARALRLIDSTPLPCGASRETKKRSDLAGHAGYGYCASHSRFFWGMRLHLITTAEGMPVMWGLANPKLDEREVMTAMLERDHQLIAAGQVHLADSGYAGHEFERSARTTRSPPGPPRTQQRTDRQRHLARQIRQWIEAIIDTLKGQLTLEDHGGRTLAGLRPRRQRLLAIAAAIWHNTKNDAPVKRSLIAYDH